MTNENEQDKDFLGPHRMVRSNARGLGSPPRTVKAYALSVQERVRVARGTPQAVVKITSYVRGRSQCHRHWSYISRKGKLELETESGEILTDLDAQRSVLDAWALRFDNRKNGRDQVHVVVSAPRGTDARAVREAARAFGQEAFAGQRYVFALHDPDTDTKTKQPHVHFAVALRGVDKKLNPRLKDLHRWRELWASKARGQGIELACSPRGVRGVGRRRPKSAIYHMQERRFRPETVKLAAKDAIATTGDTTWEHYTRERNRLEREAYRQSAARLRKSAEARPEAERQKIGKLAMELDQYAKRMPIAKTRRQQMREAITRGRQHNHDLER